MTTHNYSYYYLYCYENYESRVYFSIVSRDSVVHGYNNIHTHIYTRARARDEYRTLNGVKLREKR